MSNYSDKIAITTGDPNGIGAEITIKALNRMKCSPEKFVLISNRKILDFYGKSDRDYEIIEIPYKENIEAGKVTAAAGEFSFQSLKKACEIRPKAMVTAPVAKNAMHLAGHIYNGQTEVLQHFLAGENDHAEMLFVAGDFRVLLLTRHCALKEVRLTKDLIVKKITDLNLFFKNNFKIDNPNFALCSLNPHAGENGILGNEEQEIMQPAVLELRKAGISVTDPLPSDTLFVKAGKAYNDGVKPPYDCYIAAYHDQGLIPIKTVAGDKTVNMTIGLPIIRTSPGHGTAFDIAGKNIADENGMISAIEAVFH
ncbi:4-hydroxythreonine-4-phosphate dehydrogenase PdxA [bacterium]|nr:4-hydroxythreonine-4-phosphate dehydrogenase PdxA [bacterium]MBR6302027.1 4-hydroxythreonine-4-phosphate dehydrogenase PdxA [bacterium]